MSTDNDYCAACRVQVLNSAPRRMRWWQRNIRNTNPKLCGLCSFIQVIARNERAGYRAISQQLCVGVFQPERFARVAINDLLNTDIQNLATDTVDLASEIPGLVRRRGIRLEVDEEAIRAYIEVANSYNQYLRQYILPINSRNSDFVPLPINARDGTTYLPVDAFYTAECTVATLVYNPYSFAQCKKAVTMIEDSCDGLARLE